MKKYQYEHRTGAPFKKEHTEDIGKFVYSVKERTTENILSEIRNKPNHVIHSYIEWDDKIASEKYRLQQVRNIVNHIEVTITTIGNDTPIPMFVSINTVNGTTYEHISDAMNDKDMRKQVILRAKTELNNWVSRYQQYTELKKIICAVKKFL